MSARGDSGRCPPEVAPCAAGEKVLLRMRDKTPPVTSTQRCLFRATPNLHSPVRSAGRRYPMREWTRGMIDRNPTGEDTARMQRDGYLVVREFLDAREVAGLLEWTAELGQAPEVSGRHWVYREDSVTSPGERVIQRIENFCPYHPGFDRFIRQGALARWTGMLMGGPVVLFKDKINFKMPGGAGFKAHQDQQAGWSTYAPLFVTAMVTLDAATLENGCLEIAAGRHRCQSVARFSGWLVAGDACLP